MRQRSGTRGSTMRQIISLLVGLGLAGALLILTTPMEASAQGLPRPGEQAMGGLSAPSAGSLPSGIVSGGPLGGPVPGGAPARSNVRGPNPGGGMPQGGLPMGGPGAPPSGSSARNSNSGPHHPSSGCCPNNSHAAQPAASNSGANGGKASNRTTSRGGDGGNANAGSNSSNGSLIVVQGVNVAPQAAVQTTGRGNNPNSNSVTSQSGNYARGGKGGSSTVDSTATGGNGGNQTATVTHPAGSTSADCGCDFWESHHKSQLDMAARNSGANGGRARNWIESSGGRGGNANAGSNSARESGIVLQGVNVAPQSADQRIDGKSHDCDCENNHHGYGRNNANPPARGNSSTNSVSSQSGNTAIGRKGGSSNVTSTATGGNGGVQTATITSSATKNDSCGCEYGEPGRDGAASNSGANGGKASNSITSSGGRGDNANAGSNAARYSGIAAQGVNLTPQSAQQTIGGDQYNTPVRRGSYKPSKDCCEPASGANSSTNSVTSQSNNTAIGGRGGNSIVNSTATGGDGGTQTAIVERWGGSSNPCCWAPSYDHKDGRENGYSPNGHPSDRHHGSYSSNGAGAHNARANGGKATNHIDSYGGHGGTANAGSNRASGSGAALQGINYALQCANQQIGVSGGEYESGCWSGKMIPLGGAGQPHSPDRLSRGKYSSDCGCESVKGTNESNKSVTSQSDNTAIGGKGGSSTVTAEATGGDGGTQNATATRIKKVKLPAWFNSYMEEDHESPRPKWGRD